LSCKFLRGFAIWTSSNSHYLPNLCPYRGMGPMRHQNKRLCWLISAYRRDSDIIQSETEDTLSIIAVAAASWAICIHSQTAHLFVSWKKVYIYNAAL
jgi:hypothetical protein